MMKYLILILMVAFPTVANAAAVNDGPYQTYHSLSDNPTGITPVYSWQKVPTPMGNAASRPFSSPSIGGGGTSSLPVPLQEWPDE